MTDNKDTLNQVQTKEAIENEALVQQMLRDAKPAKVESDLEKNPVIHKGDIEQPAPMVVSKLSNSGYVWIYDTRTGEQIPCIYYLVPVKMRQKRTDGSFKFTTVDPGFRPKKGTFKCMLHPESENRAHFNELGFRTCNKSNLINKYQLNQHMKKKHPQEWAAIESERIDREKEEDRALQRLLLASQLKTIERPAIKLDTEKVTTVTGVGTDAPLYVSDKPKNKKK